MFLKQTTYKPRSGSGSQGSDDKAASSSQSSSPPKAEAAPRKSTDIQPGAITAAAAGRRRSSAGNAQYAGLNQYKRSSQDQGKADNKASWTEQKAGGGGILGGMWNTFTKGS